jgi:hypothetical protein
VTPSSPMQEVACAYEALRFGVLTRGEDVVKRLLGVTHPIKMSDPRGGGIGARPPSRRHQRERFVYVARERLMEREEKR